VIGHVRELLAELVDVACAARALPHLIERNAALELRVIALEQRARKTDADIDSLAVAASDHDAIIREHYLGGRCDAEVPDA
jgi:hypothetical protein